MDEQSLRVLLVDDDETNVARIRRITDAQRAPRLDLVRTNDLDQTLAALTDRGCDIVLLNLAAYDAAALGAYAVIAAHSPHVPVLVIARAEQENLALRIVQSGASGYLIIEQLYSTMLVRAIRHCIEQERARERQTAAERALRASEARYRALFEQSRDPIVITDAELHIVEANPAAGHMLRVPTESLHGRALGQLHADAREGAAVGQLLRRNGAGRDIEVRLRRDDGSIVWCLLSAAERLDDDGLLLGYQGILHDITERKIQEQRLVHEALHDSLTGLANRARFLDRLDAALVRRRRQPDLRFAVLFLDLDRFKSVNDTLGHSTGDAFLQHIAQAMENAVRDEDTVARLGGDEFAVLVENVQDDADALQAAERIQRRLAQPFEIDGRRMLTSASIGIALPQTLEQTAHDLLRNADAAMYRAKAGGPGRHEVFTSGMRSSAVPQTVARNR